MKTVTCVNTNTGEQFKAKIYTVKEQINYCAKRSKRGTLNRKGKPLSDFRRGEYLGRSKGLANGARIAKSKKYKSGRK